MSRLRCHIPISLDGYVAGSATSTRLARFFSHASSGSRTGLFSGTSR